MERLEGTADKHVSTQESRILNWLKAKSLERSPAVGDFYGTGIEIWAGFWPVRQLLRPVFSCLHEPKSQISTGSLGFSRVF